MIGLAAIYIRFFALFFVISRNLMKWALLMTMKASPTLTDSLYQTNQYIFLYFTHSRHIYASDQYPFYYNMGKDRQRREKRSRSRDRSRQKQKKRHKKRDFSSSEGERERQKHRKHKQDRHRNEDKAQKKPQQPKDEPIKKEEIVKQLPCWEPSGILLQFYNSRDGVSLKFHEPPESRPPIDVWKVYVFKGDEVMQPIDLSTSCYLIGKDQRICDILCLNPSISRQHAVIQFRLISKMNIEGDYSQSIRPYIMDLGSTNGTFLNDQQIESSRYYELLHKDVLRFGHSDRLYVLVKDESGARGGNEQQ